MKKLFYLVLILNAGFFAWIISQNEVPPAEVKTVVDHQPSLMMPGEVKSIASSGVKKESQAKIKPSPKPRQQSESPADKKQDLPQQSRPVKAVVAQAPTPPAQVPGEQPKMDEKITPESSDDNSVPENTKQQETISCFELGSFPTMAVADKVSETFRAAGIWAESRLHIERKKQGHVIYIPTGGSYDKATRLIQSVKDKGIRDYAILAVDGVRNTVVMGIYRTNSAAARRLEQLKGHGYDARIKEHIRSSPRYLVDFRESDNKPVPEELWGRISHNYPKANRATRKCE